MLLLDAGTGLANVTGLLGGGPFIGTMLLTHLHWDHSLGVPFFLGGDRDDARVTLLLPDQEDGTGAEELLAQVMSPPFFPIRRPGCAATGGSGRSRPASSRPRGSPSRRGRSRTRAAGRSVTG